MTRPDVLVTVEQHVATDRRAGAGAGRAPGSWLPPGRGQAAEA